MVIGVIAQFAAVVGDKNGLPGFEIRAVVELDGEAGGTAIHSAGSFSIPSRRDVIGISSSSISSRRNVVGVSYRTAEIDGVDVGRIERLPVDIDRENVVADQSGEVITLVRGDGLIKFNGDGITRSFRPA